MTYPCQLLTICFCPLIADIIASTCSELNNNYMKQQQQQQQQQQQSSQAGAQSSTQSSSQAASSGTSTPQVRLYERPHYQQVYHPHLQQPLSATAAVDSLLSSCKTCQFQPQHPHHHHHHHHGHSVHQASQATQVTQVNRLYGGGLVKAVEPNPELAANPVPAKVRLFATSSKTLVI